MRDRGERRRMKFERIRDIIIENDEKELGEGAGARKEVSLGRSG